MARDQRVAVRAGLMLCVASLVPLAVFGVMLRSDLEVARGPKADAEIVEVVHVRRSSRGLPETSAVRVRLDTADGRDVTTIVRTTRTQFDRWL